MKSADRRGEPPVSGEIREGTAGDLEALLAAAAESQPARGSGQAPRR